MLLLISFLVQLLLLLPLQQCFSLYYLFNVLLTIGNNDNNNNNNNSTNKTSSNINKKNKARYPETIMLKTCRRDYAKFCNICHLCILGKGNESLR